jgi:O-antigen/teichoic acid export membrane protein
MVRRMTESNVLSRLWRFLSGMHALALADQAVVSGTSFLTSVLIGRWAGSSQLGIYAIGLSLLISVVAVQNSLISLPYTIGPRQGLTTAAELAGNSFIYNGMFSALVLVALILFALGLSAYRKGSELNVLIWVLACVAPFALLREFSRQILFTHLNLKGALALDTAAASIQISLLSALGWTGQLSAVLALNAIGVASALPTLAWLFMTRRRSAVRWSNARRALRSNWDLGKWLLCGQLAVQVQSYVNLWLSTAIMGTAATGIYAACMSVVSAMNPLISGFTNILTPRAVLAWNTGGRDRLRTQAICDSLLLGLVTSLFCLLVVFGGEKLIRLLYRGQDYAGLGGLVTVLSLALVGQVVGVPASNALASMRRTRAIALASWAGAVVTVIVVWPLMVHGGLLGAAYGLLIGNSAGSGCRWIVFLSLVDEAAVDARIMSVLGQLTPDNDGRDDWDTSRLGDGTYAVVYEVRSKHRRCSLLQGRDSLAIKLFKPTAALNIETLHAECQALTSFSSLMDDRLVFGWRVAVPKPLDVCKFPLALLMTLVPGRNIDVWAMTGENLTAEILDEIAKVTAAAMREAWAVGQLHGDLSLQNILCDVEAKQLSFVDPGTRESCGLCNGGITTEWSPAVRDVAHLLFDVGADVKRSIGNRKARTCRQTFVKIFLQEVIESLPTPHHKQRWLEQVRQCADAHLENIAISLRSPRGLWVWLVRLIATRRLDAILMQLRTGLHKEKNLSDPRSLPFHVAERIAD